MSTPSYVPNQLIAAGGPAFDPTEWGFLHIYCPNAVSTPLNYLGDWPVLDVEFTIKLYGWERQNQLYVPQVIDNIPLVPVSGNNWFFLKHGQMTRMANPDRLIATPEEYKEWCKLYALKDKEKEKEIVTEEYIPTPAKSEASVVQMNKMNNLFNMMQMHKPHVYK